MCLHATPVESHTALEAGHVKGCSDVRGDAIVTLDTSKQLNRVEGPVNEDSSDVCGNAIVTSTTTEQFNRVESPLVTVEASVYKRIAAEEWNFVHNAICTSRACSNCKEVTKVLNEQAAHVSLWLQSNNVFQHYHVLLLVRQSVRLVEHAVVQHIERTALEYSKSIAQVELLRTSADTLFSRESLLFCEIDSIVSKLTMSKLDIKVVVATKMLMLQKEFQIADQLIRSPVQLCATSMASNPAPSLMHSLQFLAQLKMECYMASRVSKHVNRLVTASIQQQICSSLQNSSVRIVLEQNAKLLKCTQRELDTRREKSKHFHGKKHQALIPLDAIEEAVNNPKRKQGCHSVRARDVRRSFSRRRLKRR